MSIKQFYATKIQEILNSKPSSIKKDLEKIVLAINVELSYVDSFLGTYELTKIKEQVSDLINHIDLIKE